MSKVFVVFTVFAEARHNEAIAANVRGFIANMILCLVFLLSGFAGLSITQVMMTAAVSG